MTTPLKTTGFGRRILTSAGLIGGKRVKQWTFYKRVEKRIAEVKRAFGRAW